MEKSLEFNSQICTTKEQSERLLTLGLKKETADCMYSVMTKSYNGHYILEKDRQYNLILFRQEEVQSVGFSHYEYIPAWSLHRLIEMYTERYLACSVNLKIFTYEWLINEIEIHIKEGDFNKNYLEEKK